MPQMDHTIHQQADCPVGAGARMMAREGGGCMTGSNRVHRQGPARWRGGGWEVGGVDDRECSAAVVEWATGEHQGGSESGG